MKVLKGLVLSLLSFLLFLSIAVFGIAFTVKSTVLNPDFIVAEADKINVSSLAKEVAEEQIGGQLPPELEFLKEDIFNVIADFEPTIKEMLRDGIYSFYDFLLGKSEKLSLTISLEPMKTSLRDSLWQTFSEQITLDLANLPEEQVKAYLDQHYQEIIGQIPKQYLPPELAGLPEEQVKAYIAQHYQELIGQIPEEYLPPELTSLLEDQLEQSFDQYYQQFAEQILPSFEFDESAIPPEVMEQIILARQYIGYFLLGYNLLIGFMVLLVLGIILINRNVRSITRELGIVFLTYGAFEYAGIFIAKYLIPTRLPMLPQIPSSLQTWLLGLFGDLLTPLEMFSLGLLAGGVALIIVSFFFKPRLAAE